MQKKGVYRILYRDAVRASGLWLSIVLGIRVRIYSDYNPNCIICCYKTPPPTNKLSVGVISAIQPCTTRTFGFIALKQSSCVPPWTFRKATFEHRVWTRI